MQKTKVLVVDDDERILYAIKDVLEQQGHLCIVATNGLEAVDQATREHPAVAFMDITMPDVDGLEALRRMRQLCPAMPVIIITGNNTVQNAIKAMQYGAFDYLTKPLSIAKIREVMQRALTSIQFSSVKPIRVEADILNRYELVGNSAPMQEVYKLIGSISTTPNHTSVLIGGESGTGKELVARAIHANGSHAQEPFIAINCNAFPETLLESELFGHEKGTFTGATERKAGKFEVARQGTIFLDEIGDLPPNLQQKLLRVLQEREFERLGGNTSIAVGARFIAATNQDLSRKVKSGAFREDLFFRVNVATIHLPPLRAHQQDVELLAHYFLARYNDQLKKSIKGFSDDAMRLLQSYAFPGNVRELENLIERAVMLSKGEVILPDALQAMSASPGPEPSHLPIVSPVFGKSREHVLNLFERQFVIEQLARHGGRVTAAARTSRMSRQNFHRLMAKHKILAADDEVH